MRKFWPNGFTQYGVLLAVLFFCMPATAQKTWTRGAGNDNWSSANNWNPVGVPTASDAVTIPDNILFTSVKVDINASCASLTISGGVYPLTFSVKPGVTFNVTNTSGGTGLISIGAPADGSSEKKIFVGEFQGLHTTPAVNCVAITMADVIIPFSDDNSLQIWSGIVTVSGNLTLNGSENRVFVDRGKLVIGGAFSNVGNLVTTNFSGSTVEYNGVNQVIHSGSYGNLVVSGSGAKSAAAVTVNEKLSVQGTAVITGAITYGNIDPVLEYKGSMAQITSNVEFPASMPAKVIIDNPAGVGLNSNKTIAAGLSLVSGTLIAGTKLSMGAAGTPVITRSGGAMTGTLQSPANDYDVVYTGSSKTTGSELSGGRLKNITVNLSAATESLTLDQNRVPDGNVTVSSGIFNLSSYTINRSLPGGILNVSDGGTLKTGGINSLPLNYAYTFSQNSVVEYTGKNQTVNATTYGKLVAGGTGTKTLSTAAATGVNILDIQAGITFIIDGADFSTSGSVNISGTLKSTSVTGTKGFRNITINDGGLFHSTVDEQYDIVRDIIVNGTGNIISGAGVWSFVSTVTPGILGGTAAFTIKNINISNGIYHNTGLLTCNELWISGGNSFRNSSVLNVNSALTVNGGYVQNDNSLLNFSGTSITVTGGFNGAAPGNTVNYCKAGNQLVDDGLTFYNLTLSGSGTKQFSAGNTVNGTLSVQGAAIVTNIAGATPVYGPDATLEYAGSVPQFSSDIEFRNLGGPKNLTINNAAGVTLQASRTINGSVSLISGILHIPGLVVLTVNGANAINGTGFSAAKHIDTQVFGAALGALRVNTIPAAVPYLFPLGNGTHYLPCTLTPSDPVVANNTFSATVFAGITANAQPDGAAITDKSNLVDAVWTIFSSNGNTLPVNMTLGWSGLEGTNFSALPDNSIGIAAYEATGWGNFNGTGNQLNNTATLTNITTFSSFAVGKTGSFYSSAKVAMAPFSTVKTGTIVNPANTSVNRQNTCTLTITPNPVTDKLQLQAYAYHNQKAALRITAANGKTVYSTIVMLQPGYNRIITDAGSLSNGNYWLTLHTAGGTVQTIPFTK